ncbi:MAG TPA: rod shape-determining protein MreD [Trebonia sp.]|nr:rod shape-determining protein MreD [Trebonia sp.]
MIHLLRRTLAAPILLAVAVVLQVSLVNRLPLPGEAAPSLVMLVVAALAVTSGPVAGMIAGFLGGLALDIAPPGSHLVGESALVCCVVGYGCGALAAWRLSSAGASPTPDGRVIPVTSFTSTSSSGMWRSAAREAPLRTLPLMAAGVVVGEALQVGLGMLLSDPSMTRPAVQHVVPGAVTYDLLLSPFVLLLATAFRSAPEPGSAGYRAASVVLATPAAVIRARSAFRAAGASVDARPGSIIRLTFAGARPPAIRAPARPDPKLRFAAGNGSSSSRTGSPSLRTSHPGRPGAGSWSGGSAGGPRGSAWLRDGGTQRGSARLGAPALGAPLHGAGHGRAAKVAFGSRRRDGLIGGSVLANGSLGAAFRRSSGGFSGALGPSLFPGGGTFRGTALGRGTLGHSVFRGAAFRDTVLRGSTPGGSAPRGSAFRGTALRGTALRGTALRGNALWSTALRGSGARSGTLGSSALAGRAARSTGIGASAFRDKGPGRNWLRASGSRAWGMGAAPRRGRLGKGWLRPARPAAPIRRATPGRGWLSRKPPKLMMGKARTGKAWTGKTRKGGRR